MTSFSCNELKCVLINNQKCKVRPAIMNINSNGSSFYPNSILANKCIDICNMRLVHVNIRPDTNICTDKQCWNNNKWRCECRACDHRFIQNPSMCKCECDKSCDVGEYLDYAKCKCKKKLICQLNNVVMILMEMKWFM